MTNKLIQYQATSPALNPLPTPPAAHPAFPTMEPVKAVATAAVVLASSFNFFVTPTPPQPTGAQSYDNLVVNRTFVAPQDGQALFKPPPQPTGFQGYDNQVNFKTIVSPQDGQALFKPAVVTPAVYQPGSESYNNQLNFRTFVFNDVGPALFTPPAATPAVFKAGSDTYNNQINFRTFVPAQDGQALFKPPPLPTGFQTWENLVVNKTFVPAQDGQALFQPPAFVPPVFKAGSDTYNNQINFRTFVPAQDGQALFKPPPLPTGFQSWENLVTVRTFVPAQDGQSLRSIAGPVQLATGFQSWDNYAFVKPNPLAVHAELSPFIPALPSVAPTPVSTADPITKRDIELMLAYQAKLTALRHAEDLARRQDFDSLLRDVNVAAGRVQIEPETISDIEFRIRRLPVLSRKDMHSLDLKLLKKDVEQNRLRRELEEDDREAMMLIQMMERFDT